MEMKVLWAGALFLAGWLWFYFFLRQFIFNFTVAFPLIKRMSAVSDGLIHKSALRYTWVSVAVCLVFIAAALFVVLRYCSVYLIISFFAGAAIGLAFYIKQLSPRCRAMFDAFCGTYYQFVPDDELRGAMYAKKPSQMKLRLHAMSLPTDFIPEFTD